MKNNQCRVLYCSPLDLSTGGGIPRCTNHILDYYKIHNKSNIILRVFPMDRSIHVAEDIGRINRILFGVRDYIKIIRSIIDEVNLNTYDMVHITSSASLGLIKDIILLKKLRNKNLQTVVHFHFGRIPELCVKDNWEWKLIKKTISLATKIIVIDNASYQTLIKQGFKNVFLLPNPITPQISSIIEKNKIISRIPRKIVFVGHVYKTKGVFELVEACSSIPNITLNIVGKYEKEIKKQLLNLIGGSKGTDWITFTGNMSFENVVKEMLSCNVFVLPTYTEGFPNVILESMACGCPIVTTNVGAIPEMLDIENGEINGICIEPQQILQLKIAIERMLNNNDFAMSCGKNAQKRVNEMYEISVVWEQMCDIWNKKL